MNALWIKTGLTIFAALSSAICLRLLFILPRFRSRPSLRKRGTSAHLLIVLGSGGHTAEMIYMLEKAVFGPPSALLDSGATRKTDKLDWSHITHRTWVVGSGDDFSSLRAREFETSVDSQPRKENSGTYSVVTVPRARKIHQPLITSPISCLQCAWACFNVLTTRGSVADLPDLILTNGPATATVLIFTSVLLRFFDFKGCHSQGKMRTVYIESWARVKKMSLSGRLLCWVADRVLVQWEQLQGAGGRAEYHGVLCF